MAALEQYRREWDDDKKTFRASPLHDWASHGADAFRYLALAWRSIPGQPMMTEPRRDGWRIPPPTEPRKGMQL